LFDVFAKELREMLRDKRVRSTALFGPAFLIFILLFMFSVILGNVAKPQAVKVHVVATESPLQDRLAKAGFQIVEVKDSAEGTLALADGKARVIVEFMPPQAGISPVMIRYDETEQLSQIAKARVVGELQKANDEALKIYLQSNNVLDSQVRPVQISEENVAKDKAGAGEFLIAMLPYLIVIWAFYGGMGSAADLVAGEKERATLETLLISPVARTKIVVGKLLALGAICLASSLASVVGLALFAIIRPGNADLLLRDGLGLNATAVLVIFLVLIPLVAFFASLLLAISSYAKNSREAQTYLGLGSFVVLMPALVSQFIGLTDFGRSQWVNLVPVLNSANQIRLALMEKPDWTGLALTIGSSGVLAALMVALTIWLFNREEVLVRV